MGACTCPFGWKTQGMASTVFCNSISNPVGNNMNGIRRLPGTGRSSRWCLRVVACACPFGPKPLGTVAPKDLRPSMVIMMTCSRLFGSDPRPPPPPQMFALSPTVSYYERLSFSHCMALLFPVEAPRPATENPEWCSKESRV